MRRSQPRKDLGEARSQQRQVQRPGGRTVWEGFCEGFTEEKMCELGLEWALHSQRKGKAISKVRRPRDVNGGSFSSPHGPGRPEDKVRDEAGGRGHQPRRVGGRSCGVLGLMGLASKIFLLIFLRRAAGYLWCDTEMTESRHQQVLKC